MDSRPKVAVVLFDHGSREIAPRQTTAAAYHKLHTILHPQKIALLRASMEPIEIWHWLPHKLQEAAEDLHAEIIVALPFFLFPGKHMNEDVPAILQHARTQYPNKTFALAEPILAGPELAAAIARKTLLHLAQLPPTTPVAVLPIAHGNRKAPHTAARNTFMDELQALIQPHAPAYKEAVLKFEFPRLLFRRLLQLAQQGTTHSVLAPLFLASGTYTDRIIPYIIQKAQQTCPEIQAHTLPPLGEYQEIIPILNTRLAAALHPIAP